MHNSLFYGRGFAEHQSKIWGQLAWLVKMLMTLEPLGLFGSNFVYLCILTLSSEWYAKRWRGFTEHYYHCVSPSVCPSVRLQLAKTLITLEPHGSFFYTILHTDTCQHCLSTGMHNILFWWTSLCWASVENFRSVSENVHYSCTTWIIWFKFGIIMYFNIVYPLVCRTVTRLHWESSWLVEFFLWKCS